jgi:hypothetical protein
MKIDRDGCFCNEMIEFNLMLVVKLNEFLAFLKVKQSV